ncbi:MAG: HAD family phosphatase [Candidatus Shapirobacteria bacterium]|jgi:beta-phosphoglucomutase
MKKIIKCFIFDLDGTLVDTYKANFIAYKKAFGIAGVKFDQEQYKQFFGQRFDEWASKVMPGKDEKEYKKIKKNKSRFYIENARMCILNNSLVTFLEYVNKIGYFTCLTTTASQKNAEGILRYFKIKKLFDYMVFGEDVNQPKPSPECFYLCFKKFGLEPEECIVFEDSEVGFEAAVNSGAQLIKIKNVNQRVGGLARKP